MTLFGHSPGGRKAWPPGLCPGAAVAKVEHGVPLMRSKWVHRMWAHQGGAQGQGTRLADAPPHPPHGVPMHAASTTKAKDTGSLRGPLELEAGMAVPGPRRPAGGQAHPGNQPPVRKEDKLASPGWKLLEDLGVKMMEAPKGDRGGKAVSLCPPSLEKVGGLTYPSEKNTWTRGGHVTS